VENAAIITGSFNIGLAAHFLSTPVTFYLIQTLGVSATQYSAYHALKSIPWSLKFVWGMVSDEFPILNYRRKSWFFLGWLGFIVVSFALAFTDSPGVDVVIGLMVLNAVLYLIADVAADTMIIERVRWEKEILKGSVQTSYYMIRSFGGLLGAIMGALLYNTTTWGWGLTINQCFLLSALLPLTTVMPLLVPLEELISHKIVPTMTEQFAVLWETIQLRAVWQTVGFIYFYGIFQVRNVGSKDLSKHPPFKSIVHIL
jgi:MFS family permease